VMRRLVPGRVRRLRERLRALDRLPKLDELDRVKDRLDNVIEAVGRIEARQLRGTRGSLRDHEFRVYSHAGEDGIIQFLVHSIDIPSRTFVEFGVEDYREANTRFLLQREGWRGLVMDGNEDNISAIRADPVYWNHDLTAVNAFVTRENIDRLLADNGFTGDLGLLSVDIDGNDYWVFEAITAVRPAIAVVEYNHRFGPARSVTIPYDPAFVRRRHDTSWLCTGASLAAIVGVANRKGMDFVGCNSFGNNAFLVRADLRPDWMPALSVEEGFVAGPFKETMLRGGRPVVLSQQEEQELISGARLVEVP